MRDFDLRSLLEVLDAEGIRFVVIGGVAVGAHGYVRGTEDLDLVPDPDPANLDRLTDALTKLESTLATVAERSLARLREMKAAQDREQDRADLANLPEE